MGDAIAAAAATALCWSTILIPLSDSMVKVNWVRVPDGAEEFDAADCRSEPFSCPFCGVSGPCSAAVLMACEMMPPVFSIPASVRNEKWMSVM